MRKFNYKRLIVMLVVVLAMTCLMANHSFRRRYRGCGRRRRKHLVHCIYPDQVGGRQCGVSAIDLILAVFFFAKLGTAYFEYRKSGQFEWAAPAILFACLVFTLTAPMYLWSIIGI